MINKINVLPIVADHLGTLTNPRDGSFMTRDVVLFYVLPMLGAALLAIVPIKPDDKLIDFGLLSHSIVIPLIVNVLFVIYGIKERWQEIPSEALQKRRYQRAARLLSDVYKNLTYATLISIVSMFAMGTTKLIGFPAASFIPPAFVGYFNPFAIWLIYFLVYFFILHIVLTVLMITKRTHVLLTEEFRDDD